MTHFSNWKNIICMILINLHFSNRFNNKQDLKIALIYNQVNLLTIYNYSYFIFIEKQ